jgi:hypothetical protein
VKSGKSADEITASESKGAHVEKTVRIEIRVVGRRTACALLERLAPYRSFLVQHAAERWVVHAEAPGCHGESVDAAIAAIEECLDEHAVGEAWVRVDGAPYRPLAIGSRS